MLFLGYNPLSIFSNCTLLSFALNRVVSTSWPVRPRRNKAERSQALLLLLRMQGSGLGWGRVARDAWALRLVKIIVPVDCCMTHGMPGEAEGQL